MKNNNFVEFELSGGYFKTSHLRDKNGRKLYVDAESEQGDIVTCEECGLDLEVVGLDPVELDICESKDDYRDRDDDFDAFSYDDDR